MTIFDGNQVGRCAASSSKTPTACSCTLSPQGLPAPALGSGGGGQGQQPTRWQLQEYANNDTELGTTARISEDFAITKGSEPFSSVMDTVSAGAADGSNVRGDCQAPSAYLDELPEMQKTLNARHKTNTDVKQPDGNVAGEKGDFGSDRAVAASTVARGGSLDIPAVLDDDDNNEDHGNKRARTNLLRPHESLSFTDKTCDHLPTSDAQRTSAVSAQVNEYTEQGGIGNDLVGKGNASPICVCDQWPVPARLEANSHNPKPEAGGPWTTDSVVPGDMEDGSLSLFPLRSPTEEASDCIYHGGEHGCREPGHGAVSATFSDAVESPSPSAPRMNEYRGSLHQRQRPEVVPIEERKKRRRTSPSPGTTLNSEAIHSKAFKRVRSSMLA